MNNNGNCNKRMIVNVVLMLNAGEHTFSALDQSVRTLYWLVIINKSYILMYTTVSSGILKPVEFRACFGALISLTDTVFRWRRYCMKNTRVV